MSNNLKYIILSESKWPSILNIWDYHTNNRIKSIQFYGPIQCCRFSEDSKFIRWSLLVIVLNLNSKKI